MVACGCGSARGHFMSFVAETQHTNDRECFFFSTIYMSSTSIESFEVNPDIYIYEAVKYPRNGGNASGQRLRQLRITYVYSVDLHNAALLPFVLLSPFWRIWYSRSRTKW